MQRLWLILVVFFLTPMAVSAKRLDLPKIVELNPKQMEKNHVFPRIEIKFDRVTPQRFCLTLSPKVKQMHFNKIGQKCVWELKPSANFRPETKYQATLTSPRFFIFDGKISKTISWWFTTGTKTNLDEIANDMNFGDFFDKNPLARFTPHETSHFKIEWPNNKEITPITLYATFNAGINGPPIEEQKAEYERQLRAYKQEALGWIKSKGVDPKSIKVKWIPPKAKNF